MKRTKMFALVLAAALLLCSCASKSNAIASSRKDTRDEVTKAFLNARYSNEIPSQTAEHGEDEVIQWEDPAMEAHIRFILGKPEGDILRSDVWDIQVLELLARNSDGIDVALKTPVNGNAFSSGVIETEPENQHSYNGKAFQSLSSLNDLKYFDSLQYFSYSAALPYDALTDISGLRECKKLKVLYLDGIRPETLAPLENLSELQTLTLYNCGTLDLTPLKMCSALTSLSLSVDKIESLEPLTALQQLSYLGIGNGSTYPSLEPLMRMNICYLDLGCGMYDSNQFYEALDYTPLTQMKSLIGLKLTHQTRVNKALCEAILANNPDLKYLDISYTEAARSGAEFDVEYLMDSKGS